MEEQPDVRMEQQPDQIPAPSVGEEPRRIVVDVNNPNVEIQDAKRPQVPQERAKKIKVIKFIIKSHFKILEHFELVEKSKDLNLGDQIHNILFTTYNVLRQHHNQTGGNLHARISSTDFKVQMQGVEYTKGREDIYHIVGTVAHEEGIPFGKYENNNAANWYGIAGPLLNFLGGFALRRKELRLGHHTMPIEKRGNIERVVNLAQYGLYGAHHILCEGVTFPPEKRSSMAQSVGPMTSLLCYLKSDRRFAEKWAAACKRSMAHFPDIDTVLSVIREKDPTEIRPLITLLADVALIVTTRQANRMFPPPAAFSYILLKESHRVGGSVYNTSNLIENFNFTGAGAFAFYKVFQSIEWEISLNQSTDTIAKQIVYHAMFGTFKEDLSILEKITNLANWSTREQMGRAFQKATTEGTRIRFRPVQQVYYAKMAQANQTGLLTSSYSQLTSQPCFSGKTKRKFSDAFFDHLSNGTPKVAGGKSLQALVSSYSALKEDLRTMLEKEGRTIKMGTKGWKKIADLTPTLEGEDDDTLEFVGTGKFFLGRSD
uniref:Nucleocapsid protein n=1 Tax=Phasmatodean orthomyxo-related virus OKIAV172 TaxID=2746281 RepID=A0A7D7J467_9ORTO|nr:nucleocapsid protein [Phasmatodean orthomyxo-related virus OKIAV172]